MGAGTLNLAIEQGVTWEYTIAVTGLDLTGASAAMQVRWKPNAPTTLLELSTDPTNGRITLTVTDEDNAQLLLALTAVETAALTWGVAPYDLELTLASGDVVRLLQGNVTIWPEVTR